MPFQMTLSPGVMNGLDQPVVISFTDPAEADRVRVTLFEADRWQSGSTQVTESTPDDRIAEFRGQITAHRFVGSLHSPSGGDPQPPVLRVRFEGVVDAQGQPITHELHIPTQRNEHENGVFEIIAEVTGRIEGSAQRYRTQVPVFIRRWTERRPVISFVTGTAGGFFQSARDYWDAHADGVWTAPNHVEGILERVRTGPDARGYGTWGEVNIVSHGNEDHWIIRPDAATAQPRPLTDTDVADLIGLPARYRSPGEDALDAQSRVVLRGCAIGNRQALLDRVRELFGNRAYVYAPYYLQLYDTRGSEPREGFWDYFVAYVLTQDEEPSLDDCVAAFEALPEYESVTEEEWRTMLDRDTGTRERPANDRQTIEWHLRFSQDPAPTVRQDGYDPDDPDSYREWLLEVLRTDFDQGTDEQTRGTISHDWHWDIGPVQHSGPQWHVLCRGYRVRIEVRRPLLDSEGQPVTPDLNNRRHYGRSPSWS